MRRLARAILAISVFCLCVLPFHAAHAENVDVSAGVGDTSILIQGSTSPSALVTFMDGSAVIGTSVADASGNFSQVFTNQTPGIHTYQIYSQDTKGRITDTTTKSVNVQEHTQTTLTVFLSPTVEVSDNEVRQGTNITISGSTVPNASVVIYIDDGHVVTYSDASGNWKYTLATGEMHPGEHQFYVKAIKSGGAQSDASDVRTLIILPLPEDIPPQVPLPSTGRPGVPVITSPRSGIASGSRCLDVRGTAAPGTQIEIWNKGRLVGSVVTASSGKWQARVCLSGYVNDIRARACLGTVCSAFSSSTRIFLENPVRSDALAVSLAKYRYQSLVRDPITLTVKISGGQHPYRLVVDWGDGQTTELDNANRLQILTHRYSEVGAYNGTVTVVDAAGNRVSSNFSVVVSGRMGMVASWLDTLIAPAVIVAAATTFIVMFPKPYVIGWRWIVRVARKLIR